MSSKEGKTNVLLSFDKDLLLDARKVMFKNNLTLQQYFNFVIHKLVLEDASAKDLLERTVVFQEEILTKEQKDDFVKVNANSLYSLFEREDQREEK